ncbi:hypothetical protein OG2516_04291 [Oceanicola granulosus HTCC2516]|uniref:Uncharacterized protein n=1 Tax=Oceanicola granulosus (strain ATCC BAA-861 / DSM 15982 / KCTC 12143 / HTCC2516) TaxID=314256 RepID=Q2CA61_OCEGH|nr:hypothetical protein [Oceanicola granulosus]EAR49551.1 hypothetical protein OG2516_04291 [Oceanicola granulosus HTCC2516]
MSDVVDMDSRRRREAAPVSDFWFAQVDLRLGRIEGMLERLERQVWLFVWAALAILVIEALRALAGV